MDNEQALTCTPMNLGGKFQGFVFKLFGKAVLFARDENKKQEYIQKLVQSFKNILAAEDRVEEAASLVMPAVKEVTEDDLDELCAETSEEQTTQKRACSHQNLVWKPETGQYRLQCIACKKEFDIVCYDPVNLQPFSSVAFV